MQTQTIKRGIWLKDPKSGEEVCRRDLIKELYVNGSVEHQITAGNRRAIVNHLRDYYKHLVPFQIVFQATAGCDYFTKQVDEVKIEEVKKASKQAMVKVVDDATKAAEVLAKITKK